MPNSLQPHGLYIYSPWNSPGQNTGVGSLSLLQGIFPTQGLNPGLLHCRQILFYFIFYRLSHQGSPRRVKVAQLCPALCNTMSYTGQNTGVGSLSLLQGVFPTQGSNPGLPHCRQNLYQLSHQGRPRILQWVAYPFSSGSSRPRDQTGVSRIAGGFFTS